MAKKNFPEVIIVALVIICVYLLYDAQDRPTLKGKKVDVAIILGYSYFLKDNSAEKDSAVSTYIARIKPYLDDARPDVIIVTGGATRPGEMPGISEAKVMKSALRRVGIETPIKVDFHAMDSRDNIRNACDILARAKLRPQAEIAIFSDQCKRLMVRPWSAYYLSTYNRTIVAIPMWDKYGKSWRFLQRFAAP